MTLFAADAETLSIIAALGTLQEQLLLPDTSSFDQRMMTIGTSLEVIVTDANSFLNVLDAFLAAIDDFTTFFNMLHSRLHMYLTTPTAQSKFLILILMRMN